MHGDSLRAVSGNVGFCEDIDVLRRALDDEGPLVREHAVWALERFGVVSAS